MRAQHELSYSKPYPPPRSRGKPRYAGTHPRAKAKMPAHYGTPVAPEKKRHGEG